MTSCGSESFTPKYSRIARSHTCTFSIITVIKNYLKKGFFLFSSCNLNGDTTILCVSRMLMYEYNLHVYVAANGTHLPVV